MTEEITVKPGVQKLVYFTFIIGIFIFTTLVFILEHSRVRKTGYEMITSNIGLDVVGLIPRLKQHIKTNNIKLDKLCDGLVDSHNKSHDSFQSLQNHILQNNELKTIAVLSLGEKEGKSFTALNLSYSIANSGHKVLLVDSDFRSNEGNKWRTKPQIGGLERAIKFPIATANNIEATSVDNLNIIRPGITTANFASALILASPSFEAFMEFVKSYYDYIIFDTASVDKSRDGIMISHKCDATLMVVGAGKINLKAIEKLKNSLYREQAKWMGVVINKI